MVRTSIPGAVLATLVAAGLACGQAGNAVMTVRPGETNPITYVSREVHGKVRLPGSDNSKDEAKDDVTLQQFAAGDVLLSIVVRLPMLAR